MRPVPMPETIRSALERIEASSSARGES